MEPEPKINNFGSATVQTTISRMGRLLHIIFFFMLYSVEPVDTSLLLHFFGVGGVNHAKTSRMGRLIIVFIFHFVFSGASGYLAAVALLWPARKPRAEV